MMNIDRFYLHNYWFYLTTWAVIIISVLVLGTYLFALTFFCQHQDDWWNLWGLHGLPQYRFQLYFLSDVLPNIFIFPILIPPVSNWWMEISAVFCYKQKHGL